jgi:hypothetical protein
MRIKLAGPVEISQAIAAPSQIPPGEAAAHLDRAQSVVSEIVSHLEGQGVLERQSDPADRRRTLVWLTPAGQSALRRDREVLGLDLLAERLPGYRPARPRRSSPGCRTSSTRPAGPASRPRHHASQSQTRDRISKPGSNRR